MVAVAKTPRVKRANETRDLTHPIRLALNRLPGVRVARNNCGVLEWAPGKKLRYGLGIGSSDLVGTCVVRIPYDPEACEGCRFCHPDDDINHACVRVGRVFALEVKRPGVKPDAHQLVWMAEVRKLGGFACVVHSIEEALAAVERCRAGESQ